VGFEFADFDGYYEKWIDPGIEAITLSFKLMGRGGAIYVL
jgi:hypothetical protein